MKYSAITFGLILFCLTASAQDKANIVIVNAKVITLDKKNSIARSVAIKGKKILAVGNEEEIKKFIDTSTVQINANGKTIIPGLSDNHLHVIRGGRFFNLELRWDGVKTLARALQMLKEQAARTPKGEWVRVVGGWNEYQFMEKRLPTLKEINDATGGTPCFILYLYGKAFVNKSGLQALHIDANTPNPPMGLIEKDIQGNPTGLLVADPGAYVLYSNLAKLPEHDLNERIQSTQNFLYELNRLGITSLLDAGGGFQNYPNDYAAMEEVVKQGSITVRIPYYLFAQKKGTEQLDYSKWVSSIEIEEEHQKIEDGKYGIEGGGENLVMDGADYENFDKPQVFLPASMESELIPIIKMFVKKRWPFRLHATYNESISRFLNVFEEVNKETPFNGLIWFFDHAETVSPENIQRIKALGGGIAIQHRMAYQGEAFIKRYGLQQAFHSPPIKEILNAGIPIGIGTDGTRVASYNIWIALYWLISGKTIGGNVILNPENRLERITALKLATLGSASLIREENKRGSIEAGKLADIVILKDDYLAIREEKIKDEESVLTITDGKIVFAQNEFKKYSPPHARPIPAWSPLNFYGAYQYK